MLSNLAMIGLGALISSLSIFLVFRTVILIGLLKTRQSTYDFGSKSWWHWFEHLFVAVLGLISSTGIAVLKIVDDTNKHIWSCASFSTCSEPREFVLNIFFAMSLGTLILLINHMIKEETPGNDFEHDPQIYHGVDRRKREWYNIDEKTNLDD